MMGTLSFANSGKVINPLKIKEVDMAVGCCTVGEFTICTYTGLCPGLCRVCDVARRWYCAAHNCTAATIGGIGSGSGGAGCIRACGCGNGSSSYGSGDQIN